MDQPEQKSLSRQPGELVDGRYRVRREIARGGSCAVHEAEHVHLGRRVALKTLVPEAEGIATMQQRLLREGRAMALARHPQVAEVLDAGLDREGRPFLALALIEGRSLDGLLTARGRLDLGTVLALATQLAAGLDHAHRSGVVHRDLKPSNLMIERDVSGAERVRLIDFGVASISGDAAVEIPKLTRAGDRIGTYEYMPPEQLFSDPFDHRADVYALGALLYECLAGEVPYPGGYAAAAEAVLTGRPPTPLSERSPALAAVDPVLVRALSRDPEARFASAGALVAALVGATGASVGRLTILEPSHTPSNRPERRHRRVGYVTPLRVLRAGEPAVDGRTEDVSEGGVLALLSVRLPSGEKVKVRFSLPRSGRLVTVEATTRWVKTARHHAAIGLEFLDLPDPARDDLRTYVEMMAGS